MSVEDAWAILGTIICSVIFMDMPIQKTTGSLPQSSFRNGIGVKSSFGTTYT